MPRRGHAIGALLALLVLALPGCGGDDVSDELDRARDRLQAQVAEARAEFERRRDRFGERIGDVLDDLGRAIPRARTTDPAVRSGPRNTPATIDVFMTRVLDNIDRYWTRTFAEADLPAPSVGFAPLPPGAARVTACGHMADDSAAFYCPGDDTIYVAQRFAAALYRGVLRGLPGERAGYGRAAGDFAVAYVLAHEYAHNLQQELGMFDNVVSSTAKPYELHADCLSGTWAYSVFEQGLIEPGDIEEAMNTALAVGDFDVGNAQHHGTPEERLDALVTGYETGDPAQCNRFVVAA